MPKDVGLKPCPLSMRFWQRRMNATSCCAITRRAITFTQYGYAITAEQAKHFPYGQVGDVLLTHRNRHTVSVLN
ncbi:MAG: hypothetical protein R2857_00845 [Vampirovibrionales bacterium]